VTPAADIYSLGILLFQMLSGELLNFSNNYSYPQNNDEKCLQPPMELCSELLQ